MLTNSLVQNQKKWKPKHTSAVTNRAGAGSKPPAATKPESAKKPGRQVGETEQDNRNLRI